MPNIHIISDLHLSHDRADLTALFMTYMNKYVINSSSLYVLGDLFEVWIGDDCLQDSQQGSPDSDSIEFYQLIIEQFKNYSSHTGKLFFMHGNRDFLLGNNFEMATGGQLLTEPYFLPINNEKIALMHGDSLCTDDVEYQNFREMVRNPEWQSQFLSMPKEKRIEIANGLRMQSKDAQKEKSNDIMDVNQEAVERFIIDNNIDRLIHGHTHRQANHKIEIDNKTYYRNVLADWGQNGFYLEFNNSKLSDHYFS